MKINAINTISQNSFASVSVANKKEPDNPISKTMEQVDVAKASLVAGVGFGLRALWYLSDNTFLIEKTFKKANELVEKNKKGISENKKMALLAVSWVGIVVGLVGLFAGLYALFNAPKSTYEGKINAFKKTKDMDIYIKSNKVEKELYNQMLDASKNAETQADKEHLKQQYWKLRASKNEVPVFVDMQMPVK